MNLKPSLNSSFFLKVIFAISLFMLLYISSISYKHVESLSKTTELILQSYKIQLSLEQILSIVKDAVSGQRGFIISKDSLLLQHYTTAQEKIDNSVLKLKPLIINEQQNNNLDTLLQLINLRFDLMANTLKVASTEQKNEQLLDINLLEGKKVMDIIRAHIDKMDELELYNLREHQRKYDKEELFSPLYTLLIMIFSLLVFILSFFKINNDLTKLKNSNDELKLIIETVKHAEIIGEFGLTIWNLDNKELKFSDNLFRLFGCEPQSFNASIKNYLSFVHPDDRDIVTAGVDKTLNENKVYPRYYRIIRKDGEIRYFSSMGKIISEGNHKSHIGIAKDITEQQLNRKALEEQNVRLEQGNKELESFNRIASHDLQEPLRKIQTFISRISTEDKVNMSDTGRVYLSKIESSANRMRMLVDDLLLFSHTNKSEKVFNITDLNLLLEDAIQELAQVIEEKKAVIQAVQLPLLSVISFQIKQLFVNLIGNALKYSKPGISPEIIIDCGKLAVGDYPAFIKDTSKNYYKISISDNGMGFDQKFSENIFILFNRLHQKDEFPGTGIGLSICKKIAENHDGFIIAEGKPGIGATFIVFLPV